MKVNIFGFKLEDNRTASIYVDETRVICDDFRIMMATDVVRIAIDVLGMDRFPDEHFYILGLNVKLDLIGIAEIAHGGVASSFVDRSSIFRKALLMNAHSIVLLHNHPSGGCLPSGDDVAFTSDVIRLGRDLGLLIQDHVIIGGINGHHYSMAEMEDLSFNNAESKEGNKIA